MDDNGFNTVKRSEGESANIGKGGKWPYAKQVNSLGFPTIYEKTTRVGVGVGRGYSGTYPDYPFSSSSSFSSSSFSLCSSSSSSSEDEVDTNGSVFITDVAVQATGNVGEKVYNEASDYTLVSFSTDTDLLTISVRAFTGYSHYVPVITVNGTAVSNLTRDSYGQWTGTVDIDLAGGSQLSALHEDNPEPYLVSVTAAAGAEITDLTFTDGYPGSQTELKENDTYNVSITTDVACNQIQVYDYQATQSDIIDVTSGTSHTFAISIADRGSGTQSLQTVKIRCKNTANGFWGTDKVATDFHVGDGSGTIELNNDYPVISSIAQGNINYPATQEAIKDVEQATINHTVSYPSGTGTVLYSSPNTQLTIANTTTYEPAKLTTRLAGDYNISTTNFRLVATKTTNNAQTTRNAVVYIAHTDATLTVTEPATRLRSGGNVGTSAQDHTITITASQNLISAPTLVVPVGTWQGAGFSGSTTVWTRALQIHDNDSKGTKTWGAISGTNLAGKETTVIAGNNEYVIGGFVLRTMTIAAWPNREGTIGTQVSDTSKLECSNLSKGASGSLNFTYDPDTDDEVDKYTITEPTGVANPVGGLWYNKDLPNSVSNSSGLMQVELEETV